MAAEPLGKEMANVVWPAPEAPAQAIATTATLLGKINSAVEQLVPPGAPIPNDGLGRPTAPLIEGLGLAWNPYTIRSGRTGPWPGLFRGGRQVNLLTIDYGSRRW